MVVVQGRLLGVEIEAYKAPQVRVVARVGRSKLGAAASTPTRPTLSCHISDPEMPGLVPPCSLPQTCWAAPC